MKVKTYRISYAEMFQCIDCGLEYRRGYDVEHDMYLGLGGKEGSRCVYCYNKKLINPSNALEKEWCDETADRLEHQEEIKAFLELFLPKDLRYSYHTNYHYNLVIRFEKDNEVENSEFFLRLAFLVAFLEMNGFRCSSVNLNYSFSVDFKDHTRIFTR